MPTSTVELRHCRYDVVIEHGALDSLGSFVRRVAPHTRCSLITDENVGRLYADRAAASLAQQGFDTARTKLPPGEEHKSLETVGGLYSFSATHRLERRSPVVALGGGVVGDTAGFFAATWMRGLPLIQVPTTLLAMVDASIGGKVGVNLREGKNLVGAFHQPALVLIDPTVLATLPERELRCGLAECVKHAVIRDASLFDFIRENLTAIRSLHPATVTELIRRNVAIKAAIVAEDERETGVRAHLNLGHTFAHAIESTTGYGRIAHGEAVSLGMIAAAHLAVSLGVCDKSVSGRITELCRSIGLPTSADLPPVEQLMAAMTHDKKVKDDRLRLVLPDRIGCVVLRDDVPTGKVESAWGTIRAS